MKYKATVLLFVFVSVLIFAIFLIERRDGYEVISIGKTAPDIELIGIDENKITLSDLRGNVVFINFWATWCESCVDEMPSIERLYRYFSENPDFKLVTIVYRDNGNNALNYMKKNGYTFPIYLNPDGRAAKKFGITGVPESFIIDKKGILREKVIGPAKWDSPYVFEMFKTLLNEPA